MRNAVGVEQRYAPQRAGEPDTWHVKIPAEASAADIASYFYEAKDEIQLSLDKHGALCLKGMEALSEAAQFQTAISRALPSLRSYVGGTSPRTRLDGFVMTATETPPTWSIPLHQEMAYTKNGPDRVVFLCRQPATGGGGLSMLGDMRTALEAIPKEVRSAIGSRRLRLRRTLPSRQNVQAKAGIKKTWEEVFDTTDRLAVEGIAAARNWEIEWLDRNTMQMFQEPLPPTRKHPRTGDLVWHNQIHFFSPTCMIAWAARDGRYEDVAELSHALSAEPELMDNVVFEDTKEEVAAPMAQVIADTLLNIEVPTALDRGDLLIIDNVLMAHGRSPFHGQRDLMVVLADEPGWPTAGGAPR
jgi:hypothetical protein